MIPDLSFSQCHEPAYRLISTSVLTILLTILGAALSILPVAAAMADSQAVRVHVSILPQKYLVDRIGGERVTTDVLVLPGKSPATYSPSPDQIRRLSDSAVYFRIGVPFENGFIDKLDSVAPSVLLVDTRKGIRLRQMADPHDHGAHDHDPHASGDEGTSRKDFGHAGHDQDPADAPEPDSITEHDDDHDHTGMDPHTWMDPMLVKQQVITITDALIRIDPDAKDLFRTNCQTLLNDLDRLDQRLRNLLADVQGERFFVFHPSFGYFADAYGLKQVAVEVMGRAPRGRELTALIREARADNIRVIFVQPQFNRSAAEKIAAAIGGSVVSIDPLAYDYLENMERLGETVATALKK